MMFFGVVGRGPRNDHLDFGGDQVHDPIPGIFMPKMPPPNVVWPEAHCFCPVRPCVHPDTLLTQLAEYLTHFHQTYVNDALWDRHERITLLDPKVKGQGHGGIQYAGNSTFSFHNSSGWGHTILDDLV